MRSEIRSDLTETRAFHAQGWRVVGASVTGSAHVSTGRRCDDAFAARIIGGCALAVVCDGAGSARLATEGANMFSAAVLGRLGAVAEAVPHGDLSFEQFGAAVVAGVEHCRAEILAVGLSLQDHHTTLLAVAATSQQTFIAHVGDGMAAVAPEGDWAQAVVSHPRNGEYSNETFFVTEDAWIEQLRLQATPPLSPLGAAFALTDGAMPFVIGPGLTGLEPGFAEPVSRYMRAADCTTAAQALAATLNSGDSKRLSPDDKTLVWIGFLPEQV